MSKNLFKYLAACSLCIGACLAAPIQLGKQNNSKFREKLYDKAMKCIETYGDENTNDLKKKINLELETGVHLNYNVNRGRIELELLNEKNLEKIIKTCE